MLLAFFVALLLLGRFFFGMLPSTEAFATFPFALADLFARFMVLWQAGFWRKLLLVKFDVKSF